MKISEMDPLTSGESTDVFPVVRNSTNFKMNLGTLLDHFISNLGTKIANLAGISWETALSGDKMPISHDGATRAISLDNLSKWVINNVLRAKWCCGNFDCSNKSVVEVTFPREMASVPVVVCSTQGSTYTHIFSVKINEITTTGFKAYILEQDGGTTIPNVSENLNAYYIAWCRS